MCVDFCEVSTKEEREELRKARRAATSIRLSFSDSPPAATLVNVAYPAPPGAPAPRVHIPQIAPRPPHVYRQPRCHVCHVSIAPLRQHPHHVYPEPPLHVAHVYLRVSFLPFLGYVCHVRTSGHVRARCQLSLLSCAVCPCRRVTHAICTRETRINQRKN